METVLRLVEPAGAPGAARYLGTGLRLVEVVDAVVFGDAGDAERFLRRHACEPAFEAVTSPAALHLGAA